MAKQGKKTKIALIGYKLAFGGLERVFSNVSELLNDSNCEVHIIVLENEIEYPHYGTLVKMGHYSKFQRYFKLRTYLKSNAFDYVIDFRYRINPWMELLFLHYIYSGFKSIYTIHSSILEVYFTAKKWIANEIFIKTYKIVSVSAEMNAKIKTEYQFENGVVIPNSISEKTTQSDCSHKKSSYNYCIAVGRLVAMKQFDKLIDTYSESNLPAKKIHLVILGDGEEKQNLQQKIEDTQMSKFIHLLGFQEDTFCYAKDAEFLVLTSEYEGFPMVILEALTTGIPVISFDCETGPSEMITTEFNGLLVENQNFAALGNALNKFADNEELLRFCKNNAKASVKPFSKENIRLKWLDLLNINNN